MSAAALRLTDLSKSFNGKRALAPTTFEVPPGQSWALIGPSGCGKSTLLRLVVGLITPDSGSIEFGDLVAGPGTYGQIRLRIGYVIQEGGLFPHLTAAENVTLKARDLDWQEPRIAERLNELAQLVQFPAELLGRYPAQLSGGQRQRVGLMRALMLDPEVLLMDEPLGALDPIIRSRLQSDLKQIFLRLRKTVLLVTHDMSEAAYLGDEIAIMKDGHVVQRGSFQELINQPADPFVTEFIRAQRPMWSGEPSRSA